MKRVIIRLLHRLNNLTAIGQAAAICHSACVALLICGRLLKTTQAPLGSLEHRLRPARYCAAQRLDDRAHQKRASPTRCATPPPASTAEGKPPPCGGTRRLRKPKQVKAQALGARLFDPRAHPRRDTPRYRHLHRSGLTLCLCRGAPLQARPIHRPRLSLLPQRPTTVLSDNGSEFGADFAQLLKERGIQRWYTYPKTPKMNARRSLQSHDPRVLRG
jgi:transposase InsO family protein